MNKVWAVEAEDGSGWVVLGLYATPEGAEKALKEFESDPHCYYDPYIKEMEVNP